MTNTTSNPETKKLKPENILKVHDDARCVYFLIHY